MVVQLLIFRGPSALCAVATSTTFHCSRTAAHRGLVSCWTERRHRGMCFSPLVGFLGFFYGGGWSGEMEGERDSVSAIGLGLFRTGLNI